MSPAPTAPQGEAKGSTPRPQPDTIPGERTGTNPGSAEPPAGASELDGRELGRPVERPFPTLPTLTGAIGLLHTSTAEVGPLHQLRLGLHGEYFGANDFLIAGDANQRLAGGLVAGFTLRHDLELFGAILNSSNRNQRVRDPAVDRDPELIKTFGDLVLGGKWVLPISPAATFGVELGLKFLSGVSDLAVSPSSTSWWLGPLFTYDMRRAGDIPLRFHAGASFFADHSSNLRPLSSVSRNTKEVAMFAYGIAPSRLQFALAVDAPLEKAWPGVPIVPFVEYQLAYVTADADRDFQDYMKPNCGANDGIQKPCVDNRDMQRLTLGARADVYRGITVDLGLDIRLRSAGFPYGPPLAPWNLMFGLSYPLDVDGLIRPVVVTRTVEKDGPWKTEGQLTGVVRNARDGAPIPGALVAVVGHARARAVTDPDGGFATANVLAGVVDLEVTASNFEAAKVAVNVVAGKSVDVPVGLQPNPPLARLHGRVTDARGAGVQASIKFTGVEIREAKSDATGTYTASLPPGSYQVSTEAPGQPSRTTQVDLLVGEDKQLDLVLRVVTANPKVVLNGDRITLKTPLRFVGTTAKATADTEKLLDAVADILDTHGEIKHVRVVAHWDSSLPKPRATELTQAQAEAVRTYLIGRGISGARLTAVGAGSDKPLVPNLTPANRSRNRRVEFELE